MKVMDEGDGRRRPGRGTCTVFFLFFFCLFFSPRYARWPWTTTRSTPRTTPRTIDDEDDAVDDAVDEQLSKVSVWIAHFFSCLLFFEFIGTQGKDEDDGRR